MKALFAASLLLTAATLTAQVTESIDVRIVNVDVTVTSKGAPGRGLTRDDFEIFEDGRRRRSRTSTPPRPARRRRARAGGVLRRRRPARARSALPPQSARARRQPPHDAPPARHALRELEAMINDRFHGEYDWSIGADRPRHHARSCRCRRTRTRSTRRSKSFAAAERGRRSHDVRQRRRTPESTPIGDQPTRLVPSSTPITPKARQGRGHGHEPNR